MNKQILKILLNFKKSVLNPRNVLQFQRFKSFKKLKKRMRYLSLIVLNLTVDINYIYRCWEKLLYDVNYLKVTV